MRWRSRQEQRDEAPGVTEGPEMGGNRLGSSLVCRIRTVVWSHGRASGRASTPPYGPVCVFYITSLGRAAHALIIDRPVGETLQESERRWGGSLQLSSSGSLSTGRRVDRRAGRCVPGRMESERMDRRSGEIQGSGERGKSPIEGHCKAESGHPRYSIRCQPTTLGTVPDAIGR